MISMTYMLEMSGGRWTTFVGIGVEFYWVAGWLSLGTFAYFITDWRKLLLVTSIPGRNHFIIVLRQRITSQTLPGFFIVLYCWIIPESPRWLHTIGRRYDADRVVRRIASFNRKTLPDDWKLKSRYDCESNFVLGTHIKSASTGYLLKRSTTSKTHP